MYYYENGKQKTSVALPVFICCVLLVALIGVAVGLILTTGEDSPSVVEGIATATPATEASDSATEAPQTETPVSTLTVSDGSTNYTSMVTEGYTRAQIVEMCAPSVVGIDVTMTSGSYFYYGSYETTGSGSGVILTTDGYIATCAHVVDGATTVTVTLNDDSVYPATIIGTDARNDLAIIKIEAENLQPATIGDSDMLTVGEDVIAIGNPLGELRGTATSGIISAVNRNITVEDVEMELVQTDAAISPGNSGGGLFDSNGHLIGIVNAKVSDEDAEGLGFAIPVNNVISEINDLISQGYVSGRAYLGVYTQNVTVQNRNYGMFYGGSATNCVQVSDIVEGGAAEAAGIEVGDLILAVDSTQISSNSDLSAAINAYNAGDQATLTIQRDGSQFTVTVTFGEYIPQ
ncbi:MAG: trypsin-like peptidase domain-containing protein [Clostridia bacterium]|nr:trypsin-like peptidase domain-containing protein [Clostridia bacterium]